MKLNCLLTTGIVICLATFFSIDAKADILLSEVFYNAPAADNNLEWVELYNSGPSGVDLAGFSLGYGGTDYTFSTYQLSGVIGSGQYAVVGGPISNSSNGNPLFFQAQDFSSDIQNGGSTADGVAIFDVTADLITQTTLPVDVVIYGDANSNNLIDETGNIAAVDVGNGGAGSSISRIGNGWQVTGSLTPGTGSVGVPEPGSMSLILLTAVAFGAKRRRN